MEEIPKAAVRLAEHVEKCLQAEIPYSMVTGRIYHTIDEPDSMRVHSDGDMYETGSQITIVSDGEVPFKFEYYTFEYDKDKYENPTKTFCVLQKNVLGKFLA